MSLSKIKISFTVLLNFLIINTVIHGQNIHHWELIVNASDNWNYYVATTAPPSNWADFDFNASSWSIGPGGIGYGQGNEGTVISGDATSYASLYIRNQFNIQDKSKISTCLLYVDFDDAFVAYLNGHEVARANIGTVGSKPLYNQYADNCNYEAQLPYGIPARFTIHKDTIAAYLNSGNNVLALEIHNCNTTSSDLASTTFLCAGITDQNHIYRYVPNWFSAPFNAESNLPLLVINTFGQNIPDDPKIRAWLKVVDHGNGQINKMEDPATGYDGYIGIEVRGQSSQMFPKKSFGFETWNADSSEANASLVGMPVDNDWVLYAPYSDKSLLRNALTYYLGGKMGTWQPRFRFVEVYLNDAYHGIYMLTEKIKRGPERVNINKLNPDEISGDDLTGGFIVKVDKIWDLNGSEYFYTYPANKYHNARNYAFTYEYPKATEIVWQQKNYISTYLTELENILNGPSFTDPVYGYRKYLDINSFVDFQIMQEFTNSVDGYRYSTFFYKKRDSDGGKLFAGPLWDFDLCYGNVDYAPDRLATNKWLYPSYGTTEDFCMHWWARLMEDDIYKNAFSLRWKNLRKDFFKTDSIMAYIDSMVNYLGPAVDRNFQRWPILSSYIWPNAYIGNIYQNEVSYLKNWINNRLTWMDASMPYLLAIGEEQPEISDLKLYPNPGEGTINLEIKIKNPGILNLEYFDCGGRKVYSERHQVNNTGYQKIESGLTFLKKGQYILRIMQGNEMIGTLKFLIF